MVLRENLKSIRMATSKSVSSFLTKITWVRNNLGAVGENVYDVVLVQATLNGVKKTWANFETIFGMNSLTDPNNICSG